jgi:S1-C subfamily serine protease
LAALAASGGTGEEDNWNSISGSTSPCYPGFSGGPLLNASGEVVGMNTRGLAHGRAVTVPVATVNRVVEELLKKGHIARPYLGIAMQPVEVPENMRSKMPTETRAGLLVMHVDNGGPSEKAGVLLGERSTLLPQNGSFRQRLEDVHFVSQIYRPVIVPRLRIGANILALGKRRQSAWGVPTVLLLGS